MPSKFSGGSHQRFAGAVAGKSSLELDPPLAPHIFVSEPRNVTKRTPNGDGLPYGVSHRDGLLWGSRRRVVATGEGHSGVPNSKS